MNFAPIKPSELIVISDSGAQQIERLLLQELHDCHIRVPWSTSATSSGKDRKTVLLHSLKRATHLVGIFSYDDEPDKDRRSFLIRVLSEAQDQQKEHSELGVFFVPVLVEPLSVMPTYVHAIYTERDPVRLNPTNWPCGWWQLFSTLGVPSAFSMLRMLVGISLKSIETIQTDTSIRLLDGVNKLLSLSSGVNGLEEEEGPLARLHDIMHGVKLVHRQLEMYYFGIIEDLKTLGGDPQSSSTRLEELYIQKNVDDLDSAIEELSGMFLQLQPGEVIAVPQLEPKAWATIWKPVTKSLKSQVKDAAEAITDFYQNIALLFDALETLRPPDPNEGPVVVSPDAQQTAIATLGLRFEEALKAGDAAIIALGTITSDLTQAFIETLRRLRDRSEQAGAC